MLDDDNQTFINREIDREEIAMEETNLPFNVRDLSVPELEEKAVTDEEAFSDFQAQMMAAITQMMGGREKSIQVRALESLMPILDAGIDVMAMEGYVKTPGELRTVEGQMAIRGELVDGILAAFDVFDIDKGDVYDAMQSVHDQGFRFKQDEKDIADRLTVWDEVSIVNHLYGPRMAGDILQSLNRNRDDG